MKHCRLIRSAALMISGATLLQFGGCIGPNPGFFISTAVANATIGALVNRIFNGILGT